MGEEQYIDLLRKIMEEGTVTNNRTNVETTSLFGCQMRFDIFKSFPLFTTKNVPFRLIAEELLWFLSGSTDNSVLQSKNIHIWDKNSDRSFLDNLGFYEREENDIGPGYGFQWRHYGAIYDTCKTNYEGQGVDQITELIKNIKTDPDSRRLILNAWNPVDLEKVNLPPCHCFAHFRVLNKKLNCLLYQRSGDMALGVPFNVASYSLLTYMIAKVCDLSPGVLVHTIGDAHIYKPHYEGVKEQIERTPTTFPLLTIKEKKDSIFDYTVDDFIISNYNPQRKIYFEMVV
jgi:thymidylate synthase